ncbi:L,D-transpeptidase [Martelella radicis]|uniref:Lipoprotein-anchoring transpeptidase ErfK/SrfK n=1 Tax=Martelella radicis TaxID=1397476 RepID=A0A7W6KKF9_9HYPH|nr:L,D-transpeptidase [Martelella radicis]MBB4121789.1 lipoprotein-anchoring transpeptidase ErfK/SrfK [Martelella radicis]
MRAVLVAFFALLASVSFADAARKSGGDIFEPGKVVAAVSLSSQTMKVIIGGYERYVWPVSTGAGSYATPEGIYGAEWLSKNHRSRKYNNAPMPYAIFFYHGYAVHGTDQLSRLGSRASHGCVRLHPDNAALLFELAQSVGLKNMTVIIGD